MTKSDHTKLSMAVCKAVATPDSKILFAVASSKSAARVLNWCAEKYKDNSLVVVRFTAKTVEFWNGSRIMIIDTSKNSFQGYEVSHAWVDKNCSCDTFNQVACRVRLGQQEINRFWIGDIP